MTGAGMTGDGVSEISSQSTIGLLSGCELPSHQHLQSFPTNPSPGQVKPWQSATIFICNVITDRIRSTRREVIFTFVSPPLGGASARSSQGGTPAGGYPSVQFWMGYPSRLDLTGVPSSRGYPLPRQGAPHQGVPLPVQDNKWSTWYTAVGMPLAFTQEDFLVQFVFFS